jgi:predicted transcriptional regulator
MEIEVKNLRKKLRMSQNMLAKLSEVSQAYISLLELGFAKKNSEKAERIISVLKQKERELIS